MSVVTLLVIILIHIVDANSSIARHYRPSRVESSTSALRKRKQEEETNDDAYVLLARAIQDRLTIADVDNREAPYDLSIIVSALRSLSKTQSALKKIDGAAHEAYQRTHHSSTSLDDDNEDDENDDYDDYDDDKNNNPNSAKGSSTTIGGLKVAGRMSRNAARIGCVASALFAAELCEFGSGVDNNDSNNNDDDGTLASWTGREVILNTTISSDDLIISVLILYERGYDGGAGVDHGSVDDLLSSVKSEIGVTVISEDREFEEGKEESDDVVETTKSSKTVDNSSSILSSHNPTSAATPRGRFLVILSDHLHISRDLSSIMSVLDKPPRQLRLRHDESTSVCESLYHTANKVLDVIGPVIAATSNSTRGNTNNVDGVIVVDDDDSQKVQQPAIHFVGYSLAGGVAAISACIIDGSLPLLLRRSNSKDKQQQHDIFASPSSLNGSGRARTSALCLGPPPCLSSNVNTPFITSIIHGDDVVCRTSRDTIDSLCDRTRRTIKGGILGRSVGWMSQAVKLTVSGLTSSSSSKERLVIPGQVYLIRPRRIGGGSSSIHEVGGRGGNTLRATLLWQLNDILLSKSLWSHHRLETYIQSSLSFIEPS
jgi:hypothetical protein